LREITGKVVSAEKMEIARLKAELAKTRMERDILKTVANAAACGDRNCCALSWLWKGAAVHFLVASDP